MLNLFISSSASWMRLVGREGDRVDNHPAFRALDAVHLGSLFFDGQVLVDDPDAAVLSHGDGQRRLRDRVHCRARERNVQADVAREARADIGMGRQDV